MLNFMKGLQIFLKYGNPAFPFTVDQGLICISEDLRPEGISQSDKDELVLYGFNYDSGGFYYYA